jgi:CRISPR-associated endonuclease/helicase Cas3
MRVLVEQTARLAKVWADRSGTGAQVFVLMGGEIDQEWEFDPDKPTILIGTQDMLVSRALNRGYAMSRYRWPVHFGLLNNDCLWVCDEIQLMGNGLGTTTQMQSFRNSWGTFGPVATWWMSAMADYEWLQTVDYRDRASAIKVVELSAADRTGELGAVCNAKKPMDRLDKLDAKGVLALHRAGSFTLVVVNTVGRARELYESLRSTGSEGAPRRTKTVEAKSGAEMLLIHSRFRPPDRKRIVARLVAADHFLRGEPVADDQADTSWLNRVKESGLIVVSTQVVEAGVDLSADTLITELAPWPSIVQRLGRCNRRGKQNGSARVRWMPLPDRQAPPYEPKRLAEARAILDGLKDGSITGIEATGPLPPMEFTHVIRRHDVHGLFSTEPDFAGGFTDISHMYGTPRQTPPFTSSGGKRTKQRRARMKSVRYRWTS